MTYGSDSDSILPTMAKKRDRYTVTGNMAVNGQSLKGVVLVDSGPCGFGGHTTAKDGSKLLKKDLSFRKFKFEDPKVAKQLGLPKTLIIPYKQFCLLLLKYCIYKFCYRV